MPWDSVQEVHIVTNGESLSEIAVHYKVQQFVLQKLNNISNPNLIYVGQKLKINGTPTPVAATNNSTKAGIKQFGLLSGSDRTIFATWDWVKTSETENYHVKWHYDTGDNVWFVGQDQKVTDKQSLYNAPQNAKRVKFIVKPIPKSSISIPWVCSWSTAKTYDFSSNPPVAPSAPAVKLEKFKLTASLENISTGINATHIQFQIVKDDSTVFKTGNAAIVTNSASYACDVTAGSRYKVRCRSYKGSKYSEWSQYSSNVETMPSPPSKITTCKATSKTSVYLAWSAVNTATAYDIEYATKKEYFDRTNQTNVTSNIEFPYFEFIGLESGYEYFFRVRAVNNNGQSAWTSIKSIKVGTDPAAPTTWSSSTSVIVGEPLNLYWVHNTEDGSSQTYAELELIVDGEKQIIPPIKNTTDEEEKDKTSVYSVDTTDFRAGAHIDWRVRTAGVTLTYGDWSVQRTVDIYAPPTLELHVKDNSGKDISELTAFPFRVTALAGPSTQMPIGYSLTVVANESYDTTDRMGNPMRINTNDTVYSRFFDISDPLDTLISANNIDLENNITYTVKCTVSMNSGLTADAFSPFTVAWGDDVEYEPNAEIGIDTDTLSAFIRPYCEDAEGNLMENVLLSVYRREFDGRFTEIATNLNNVEKTFVTDPHPALDYARYRIVATSALTGAVGYYDTPGYPVGGTEAVIQWDEHWTEFDVVTEDALEQPAWSGSMLRLPYNIAVDSSYKPDVSLVEYIGREHPVAYYGTQRGETQSWSMVIDKEDKETLYALRRLAIWMGDVYVREPSGSGYWANVVVSMNQSFDDLTIPVALNVTRVEGGI